MLHSARLFSCLRCHAQCVLCRRCDRGNVYCGSECSTAARTEKQREANRRHARSRSARRHAAARQAARRIRIASQDDANVTDQGSAATPGKRGCERATTVSKSTVRPSVMTIDGVLRCQRCICVCDPFLRTGFLEPHERTARPEQFPRPRVHLP
jgi:hypothetical protein